MPCGCEQVALRRYADVVCPTCGRTAALRSVWRDPSGVQIKVWTCGPCGSEFHTEDS